MLTVSPYLVTILALILPALAGNLALWWATARGLRRG
jgi:hypothetical protein